MTSPGASATDASETYELGYLTAAQAAALDRQLMTLPGFTLEQRMELAGLAVAEAVYQVVHEHVVSSTPRVLILCGPGNNGGDGLVAARHLCMFGMDVTIVYPPREPSHAHYTNLVQQCRDLHIPIWHQMPDDDVASYHGIVDAMFGFSFVGPPRPPYAALLAQLAPFNGHHVPGRPIVIAVDVPSGWNVDDHNEHDDTSSPRVRPHVLVSLTAPKVCARHFTGRHFVGGRFVPPHLAEAYRIRMPPYPGVSQVMEVTRERIWPAQCAAHGVDKEANVNQLKEQGQDPSTNGNCEGETWQRQYAAYCAEKEAKFHQQEEQQHETQATDQNAEEEPWEAQYAAHCAEKEAALDRQDQQCQNQATDRTGEDETWNAPYAAYGVEKEVERNRRQQPSNYDESSDRHGEDETWNAQYAAYCAAKEAELNLQQVLQDFSGVSIRPEESETWEAQYAAHCTEKEAELNRRDLIDQSAPLPRDGDEPWEAQYAAYCAERDA